MVVAGVPGMSQLVCILRKEEAEEGEKESRDFEPQNPAGVGKGSPERLAKFLGARRDSAPPRSSPLRIDRSRLLHAGSVLLHGMSRLRGAAANDSRGNTDADAQFPAKTVRLHTQKCSSGISIRIATIEHRK